MRIHFLHILIVTAVICVVAKLTGIFLSLA